MRGGGCAVRCLVADDFVSGSCGDGLECEYSTTSNGWVEGGFGVCVPGLRQRLFDSGMDAGRCSEGASSPSRHGTSRQGWLRSCTSEANTKT